MKDIDFDELDRAVSSVLGGATPKQDESTSAVSTAVADTDSDGMVNVPASSASSETETPPQAVTGEDSPANTEASQSPAKTTPLAIKRRGKFMDVVHPSSDMNPTSTAVSVARKSITPLTLLSSDESKAEDTTATSETYDVASEATPTAATEVVTEATVSTVETTATEETEIAEGSLQSDTLGQVSSEAVSTESSNAVETPLTETTESTTEEAPVADQPGESGEISPEAQAAEPEGVAETGVTMPADASFGVGASDTNTPETPFLTDAKVEKRPLGGFGDNPAGTTPPADESSATADADSPQTPPPVSLPRELQPDVVQVEAIHDDTKAPAESLATATAPTLSTVPAADDSDSSTHSLFDTSSYHEPIAHAKKSTIPGWAWWLIGLMVCLAAGAGVGYFLFVAGL